MTTDTNKSNVTVERVGYRGVGVAHAASGKTILVRGALPGEVVDVSVVRSHRTYDEAELAAVVSPSASRLPPACPYARDRLCPGCTYQHVEYPEEVRIKQSQIEELLERTAAGRPAAPLPFLPPVPSPSPLHYRNKVALHGFRRGEQLTLGYVGFDNRTIVDIEACPLAAEALNEALPEAREAAASTGGDGRFRMTLRFTETDGVCWWSRGSVRAARLPRGEGKRLTEVSRHLGPLEVPLQSFYQVNAPVADEIARGVTALMREIAPALVADVYCGVGFFALAAAEAGIEHVLGVDTDRRAVAAARRNAAARGLERRVEFQCADAAAAADGILSPLSERKDGAVILDPPRRGLDPRLLEALCAAKVGHLVYISCAPDTLARDVRQLRQAGYLIRSARLHDMFPRTAAFETMVHLTIDQ